MTSRPTLVLLAIALLIGGALFGCGPEKDDSPSSLAFDTTAPSIPTGITATRLPDGQVMLSWRANRTDPDLAGYVIYRSDRLEGGFLPVLDEPVRSNSWIDEEIEADRPAYYRIAARDASSNQSPLSPVVASTTRERVPTAAAVLETPAR